MPNSTLIPGSNKQDDDLNPGQRHADQTFNELANDEKRGTINMDDFEKSLSNDSLAQDAPSTPEDYAREARRQEANAAPSPTWKNNTSTDKKVKLTPRQLWTRVGIFGGGAGGIIGIILFLLTGLLPISGILLNLGETATANRDVQNNILTKRLYKVIDSKMVGGVTSGSCSVVKVACRFSKPSNALLARLDDNGIKAYKGDTPITKTRTGFPDPSNTPDNYRFTNAAGKEIKVAPKDFVATLKSNPEFNKAFTTAFNMRYWGYADQYIKKLFYKKEGIDRSGKSVNDLDEKDPQKSIKAIADGAETDNTIKSASGDGVKNAASDALEKEAENVAETGAKRAMKTGGDPLLLAGTAACVGINLPSIFAKVARAYQMRQEISIAFTLALEASSMLKAGDMSDKKMETIGGLLTATTLLSDGTKTKSPMDSSGIKSILFGDNVDVKSDSSFQKFVPGYGAIKATSGITAFAQSDVVKNSCQAIESPEAQAAVAAVEGGLSVGSGGIGAVVIGALKGAAWAGLTIAGVEGLMTLAKPLISQGVSMLISAIPASTIADIFGNSDIANASGEDLGNVIGGGLSFFYSNAALSTGSAPLTTSQLATYQQETQDTMIAYAKQDRVGRSPLDVSSPYTFLGSIVSNFYKYAYVPNNITQTILSSVGYTLSQPFKLFSPSTYAAAGDMTALYSHASEFGVDPSVAVGPYGDIAAGIPTEYSNASTADVYNGVSDQVDEDSGQPKEDSNIQGNLDLCSDGDLLTAKSCTITSQSRADESLYMYDLRINDILDGTNTDTDETSSSTATMTVDDANLFKDSTSIACAPGTTDAGTSTGYHSGTPIPVRLCSLPNTTLSDGQTGPGLVNSRASGVAYAMFNQMKTDLGLSTVTLNDSFRTMAQQQEAYAQYGSGQAATPGYSNHQMGYAFDINMGSANGGNSSSYSAGVNTSYPGNKVWEWLKANASKYHFSQYSQEGWHWSINGE